jgi:uncharacterized repeat protein (TIGR01451 family)
MIRSRKARWSTRAMLALASAVVLGLAATSSAMPPLGSGSGIGVNITASPARARPGDTVTFRVTVTNRFYPRFLDVSVKSSVPSCDRASLGPLNINTSSKPYTCTVRGESGGHLVTVTATGKLSAGQDISYGYGYGYGFGNDEVTGWATAKYTVTPKQGESPYASPPSSKSPSPSISRSGTASPSSSRSWSASPLPRASTPSSSTSVSVTPSRTVLASGSPSSRLPFTGGSTPIGPLAAGALGLLAAGGVLVILTRRRRMTG